MHSQATMYGWYNLTKSKNIACKYRENEVIIFLYVEESRKTPICLQCMFQHIYSPYTNHAPEPYSVPFPVPFLLLSLLEFGLPSQHRLSSHSPTHSNKHLFPFDLSCSNGVSSSSPCSLGTDFPAVPGRSSANSGWIVELCIP